MDKKTQKKIKKLENRIHEMESDLKMSLQKKSTGTAEINVGKIQAEILKMRKQVTELKNGK